MWGMAWTDGPINCRVNDASGRDPAGAMPYRGHECVTWRESPESATYRCDRVARARRALQGHAR